MGGGGEDFRILRFRAGGRRFAALVHELDAPLPDALTPAERQVALGLLRGWSNAEIARARGSSVRTVANQVASVLRKMNAGSRGEVALRTKKR